MNTTERQIVLDIQAIAEPLYQAGLQTRIELNHGRAPSATIATSVTTRPHLTSIAAQTPRMTSWSAWPSISSGRCATSP